MYNGRNLNKIPAGPTWQYCSACLLLVGALLVGCGGSGQGETLAANKNAEILNAGFLVTETVFNSELMAPFDIFHHTIFRDDNRYIRPFIVSPDGKPFRTFEGLVIEADYSFESVPKIDILVIPSTDGSMSADLENREYMDFIKRVAETADWVVTLCDGAFPLAATGLLDERVATTFPGDRDAFAERFSKVDLRYDANFVVDDKFITSVGGALSYEPALYLVERLYSRDSAVKTAEGMVLDWEPSGIPHIVNGQYVFREGGLTDADAL